MSDLSPTMREALDAAKALGGLVRYPGGFWCRDGLMEPQSPYWGAPTVQALVSRGLAEYTEWKDGRNGRFPIRMSVKAGTT